jgi:hypothetical protein
VAIIGETVPVVRPSVPDGGDEVTEDICGVTARNPWMEEE